MFKPAPHIPACLPGMLPSLAHPQAHLWLGLVLSLSPGRCLMVPLAALLLAVLGQALPVRSSVGSSQPHCALTTALVLTSHIFVQYNFLLHRQDCLLLLYYLIIYNCYSNCN